jgi:hypothetical protein
MARKGRSGRSSVTLAQSGGRNTTFGGGKGGVPLSRNVTKGASEGTGMQGGFNRYTIRTEGGDRTSMKVARKNAGAPPPVHPGDSKQVTGIVRPKQLPPVLRGSTYANKGQYR